MDNILDAMKYVKEAGDDITTVEPESLGKLMDYFNATMQEGIETLDNLFPNDDDKREFLRTISACTSMLTFQTENPMMVMMSMDAIVSAAIHATKFAVGLAKKEGWFSDLP